MNPSRIILTALCFLVIFGSGFRLERAGQPYNTLIFTVHKLAALAAVILIGLMLYRANQAAALNAGEWAAGTVIGVLVLGLFATGAWMSITESIPAIVRQVHHVTPYLTVLAGAATIFAIAGRQ